LWWNSNDGSLYIYYNDSDSAQWIITVGGLLEASNASTIAISAFGAANAAFDKANSANVIAVAAFDKANVANNNAGNTVLKTGDTMTGNLIMSGVNGRIGINTSSPRSKFDISGAAAGQVTTLTDAATITPDFSSNNNFTVTLGGNRTLANATNTTIGQSGVIYLIQDGTGSRTLSFGLAYKFPSNSAPTLTTTANAVDAIVYSVRAANSYVCQILLSVGNRNDT